MPFADPVRRKEYARNYARRPDQVEKRNAYYIANHEKILVEMAAYRVTNPDRFRGYRATSKYKIRRQGYRLDPEKIAKEIANALRRPIEIPNRSPPKICECCGLKPHGRTRLHFDHEHATGRFRGWACHGCNTGSGLADNPALLQKRIDFLAQPYQEGPIQWALPKE